MPQQRRKFSDQEKLNVLQQAHQQGISTILRHYNLSYSVFTRWKKKFQQTTTPTSTINALAESKLLQEENMRLKKIIADLALSVELKNEELKRLSLLKEKRNS